MNCLYCENPKTKRNMCDRHYRQWWRKTNPQKNKDISNRGDQKRKIQQFKPLEYQCKQCLLDFKRKRGSNQIYCSKRCQSKFFFKKKMQNVNFKLIHNLRSRLRKALNEKNQHRDKGFLKLLDCHPFKLKIHLQLLFRSNPRNQRQCMTWSNHGEWHIDHIKPLASFDLSNPEQLKIACHYTNLQPLWAFENLDKGNS